MKCALSFVCAYEDGLKNNDAKEDDDGANCK